MIYNFGDRDPDNSSAGPENITAENWTEFRSAQEEMAKQLLQHLGIKLETHKVLLLIDLQGMYLNLHEWLREYDFPIDGGLVLSRFAFLQIRDIFQKISEKILKSRGPSVFDFENVLEKIRKAGPGQYGGHIDIGDIYHKSTCLNIVPEFDLFYAPAPLEDIEDQLKNYKRKGNLEAARQLRKIKNGILKLPFGKEQERYYDVYNDFVEKLKVNSGFGRSEEGFFNYFVGERGLQVFDEKEVDTRIVIRAMDAFYNYEADSICIVSSDQDFTPLRERAGDFGVDYYQSDLGKFREPTRIGRKIKELGDKSLPGRIDPEWPLDILVGACSSVEHKTLAIYKLTIPELNALCELYNTMNPLLENKLSIVTFPDGEVRLRVFRPPE